MVEEWVEELVYQVAVSAVYLHFVESGLACQIHSAPEATCQFWQFVATQTAHQRRAVEVKSCAGAHGNAAADFFVAHIAAVAQLYSGGGSLAVNAVCQASQAGHDVGLHHQLAVEAETALGDGCIGHRCHANAATRHAGVVVVELLAGCMTGTHALEGRAANRAIAQRERSQVSLLKY